MGIETGSTVAVQAARPTEENPMMVPQPAAEANQRPGLGTHHRQDALEPREWQSGEQGQQDVGEGSEATQPTADTPHAVLTRLGRRASTGPRARTREDRRLHLAQRRVAVGAHVFRQESVVVPAASAQQHVHHPGIAIEPAGSLPVRNHGLRANRARHGREISPTHGVEVAREAGEG
jgi:hypothetical protein